MSTGGKQFSRAINPKQHQSLMKIQTYEEPGLLVQWREPYEGPNNFLTYWPSVSRIFLCKAELLAAVPSASAEFQDWLSKLEV